MDISIFFYLEAAASFLVPLKDTSVNETETAKFTCELSKEGLKPKWYKNGKLLKPTKKTSIKSDGKVHNLAIQNCTLKDTSKITIKIDSAECDAQLNVKGLNRFILSR